MPRSDGERLGAAGRRHASDRENVEAKHVEGLGIEQSA